MKDSDLLCLRKYEPCSLRSLKKSLSSGQ